MSDARAEALAALPDPLLATIVEATHAVLRASAPDAVSVAARPLLRFDRRGLASSAARRQVVAVLRREATLAELVASALVERPEIAAMVEALSTDPAAAAVAASERGDLAMLAAAVWAADQPNSAYVLGAVAALHASEAAEREWAEEVQAMQRRHEQMEAALARSADQLADAQQAQREVTEALRAERAARRDRERAADAATDAVRDELVAAHAARDEALRQHAALDQQRERDQARIARLEAELQTMAEELVTVRAAIEAPPVDVDAVAALRVAAEQLVARLDALEQRVREAPLPERGKARPKQSNVAPVVPRSAPTRRSSPNLPGGLAADSVDGAVAMLTRTPDLVIVVDGYNVTKSAWPEASLSDQRERLARALHQVHLRYGCDVVCCFDGDGTEGVRPLRRAGLRIVFSARGQQADDLVVEHIEALPKRIPVIVASSDAWIREHATRAGAVMVSSQTLLEVARAAGRR